LAGAAFFAAVAAFTPHKTPYLRILPVQAHDGDSTIQINFTAYNFDQTPDQQAGLTVIVSEPGQESARFTQAAYSPTEQGHIGRLSFTAGKEETNNIQVIGSANNDVFFLQASYRLQRVDNRERTTMYASDGNLTLELNPNSLSGAALYFMINAQNTTPGPPPEGYRLISKVYEITASGSVVQLGTPAALTIAYDRALVAGQPSSEEGGPDLAIFWWNADAQQWNEIPANPFPERHFMATVVTTLGIYAVMQKV
jgi:hypothetical protein